MYTANYTGTFHMLPLAPVTLYYYFSIKGLVIHT